MLTLLIPSLALAADPPDTQVNVAVVTPGDVDLDVGVSAGGDVNVTVDGIDMKQTAAIAQEAFNRANSPTNFFGDYYLYWRITGIGPRIEGQIAELQALAGLLVNSQAKLINEQGSLTSENGKLLSKIESLGKSINSSIKELQNQNKELIAQDDKTWNQLMYGAEAHIAILNTQLDEQTQKIDSLQSEIEWLNNNITVVNSNHADLVKYTDYLRQQFLNYFYIMGGIILVLGILLLNLYLKLRKR